MRRRELVELVGKEDYLVALRPHFVDLIDCPVFEARSSDEIYHIANDKALKIVRQLRDVNYDDIPRLHVLQHRRERNLSVFRSINALSVKT